MITALRSRAAGLIALVCVAVFGAAAFDAPSAFARVDPNGPYPYPAVLPKPAAAVHQVSNSPAAGSGLAVWLVVVIAVGALAVGVVLAEGARLIVRNRRALAPAAL